MNTISMAFLKQFSDAFMTFMSPEGEELLVIMERYRRLDFSGANGNVEVS